VSRWARLVVCVAFAGCQPHEVKPEAPREPMQHWPYCPCNDNAGCELCGGKV